MSSRQEEKERRRNERQAREAEEARRAAIRRRLQIVGGALLGVALVAGIAIAVVGGSSGKGDSKKPKAGAKANPEVKAAAIPPLKNRNLASAAKQAHCIVKSYPQQGRTHVTTVVTYHTNPPTSGNHNPVPADDGDYSGKPTPAKENYVHTLEHGRVEFQYRPGTPAKTIAQMRTLFSEQNGYHALLFENNTKMPYEVAATAWTRLIGCKSVNAHTWDALRDFRTAYTDTAPEQIP
jgi:hypothetical protein